MTDLVKVMGLIIKTEPIGEYDRRIVMLTTDKGKITAFVKGARKMNNRFVAGTNLFCFGEFTLFQGRNSYSVNDINISNYFSQLHDDFEGAYYGMYFAQIADYYARENSDDKELLKLMYQSLRALCNDKFEKKLVRAIYEIKAIAVNGEYGLPKNLEAYKPDTVYALKFILDTPVEKLYTFTVKPDILEQLQNIGSEAVRKAIDVKLKTAEMLDGL